MALSDDDVARIAKAVATYKVTMVDGTVKGFDSIARWSDQVAENTRGEIVKDVVGQLKPELDEIKTALAALTPPTA